MVLDETATLPVRGSEEAAGYEHSTVASAAAPWWPTAERTDPDGPALTDPAP